MPYVYTTPSGSPSIKNKKMMCPWEPKREGNSNEVIHIRFPIIVDQNRFSTPVKERDVNPYNPGAPVKSAAKRKSDEIVLNSNKKSLFTNNEILSPYSPTLLK